MVVKMFSLLVCLSVVLAVAGIAATANAAQCGPAGCPPLKVPVGKPAIFGPGPAGPMPPVPFGPPMMSGAKQMPCMPNCPPACPPPTCAPPPACEGGFNPLSAIFSAVTLPFRLIGGAISKARSCEPPACAPGGFYPMQPPGCAPVCAPPAVKCRPNPLHAGYMNMPRPMHP
jgi:hypothetical protein